MFINDNDFTVIYSSYSERHYRKVFKKKHKKNWDVTEKSIFEMLKRISRLQCTNLLDLLKYNIPYGLFKFDFKIAKSNKSAKTSGNRCVLFVDNENLQVEVLFLYSKNDINTKNETQEIYNIVQREFSDYWEKLKD